MRERGTYYDDQNNGSAVVKISCDSDIIHCLGTSAANRLISEVVQSQRRPLLGPSPG